VGRTTADATPAIAGAHPRRLRVVVRDLPHAVGGSPPTRAARRRRTIGPMSEPSAPLDVREHRFGAGPPLTVGVEEEYMLLDPATYDLVPGVESLLRAERHGAYAGLVATELFESEVEFHTPVCRTIGELGEALRRVRAHAAATANGQGLCLGSAGTHPFGHFERQPVTARER
jgi:hypothetical protein